MSNALCSVAEVRTVAVDGEIDPWVVIELQRPINDALNAGHCGIVVDVSAVTVLGRQSVSDAQPSDGLDAPPGLAGPSRASGAGRPSEEHDEELGVGGGFSTHGTREMRARSSESAGDSADDRLPRSLAGLRIRGSVSRVAPSYPKPTRAEKTMAKRQRTKGISLAKGPVGLVGLVLLAYGITALIFGGHSFTLHVPNGAAHGKTWLGLEVNGWSDLLFIVAGLLLLFGAPLHWGAKGMSLIVGLVFGAAALIAVGKGDGVFGIFAANHVTELVWGAAAVLLIVLALLPRVGGKTQRGDEYDEHDVAARRHAMRRVEGEPRTVEREPAREPVQREVAHERSGRVERESSPASGVATGSRVAPASSRGAAHRDTTTGRQ